MYDVRLFAERGVCLPTVLLWLMFLYIEVAVRLRELRNFPFHLDLCRPFAAHWFVLLMLHNLMFNCFICLQLKCLVFLKYHFAVSVHTKYIHTGWSKKTVPQFYFCDNFRKCTPIFTIFSLLEQEIHAA